nr:unnamed protein product [Callosobruchus analis]
MKKEQKKHHILKKSASNDDHSVYGQHVANELRKLSPISQAYVKHTIGNVLFKAALGLYDNQQIVINRTQISPERPPVAIPSPGSSVISLDNNSEFQSTCYDQYSQPMNETIPAAMENPDVPKNANQTSDNESHSILVEYLGQSSDHQYVIINK